MRNVLSPKWFSIIVRTATMLAAVATLYIGCSPKGTDQVVATVGNESITLQDYEKLYVKSNATREAGAAASQEDREKFLSLIVKYKLKLADARRSGMQNNPGVQNEILQYRGSLAASFLTERELSGPGIRQLYDRKREEIRASHILLDAPAPEASSADSQAAYTKAMDIIREAKSGKDFGDLAVAWSKDPSAKQNRGDLYYFTAGQMVPQFEDAAYGLRRGEISSTPTRTQYGLHIIKVHDRHPSRGEIRASHIMLRFPGQEPTPADTQAVYTRIKALLDSLKSGVDFAGLAIRHSEDPGSSNQGGDLGFFSRRRWPRPFDDTAFVLKVGQFSQIVRTSFGYHLIRVTEEKPPQSFEESKAEIQQLYQQTRFQEDYSRLVERLKKEAGYRRNTPVLNSLLAACDSTKTVQDSAGTAGISDTLRRSALMTFTGGDVSVDSVLTMMKMRPDLNTTMLQAQPFSTALEKVVEGLAFSAKADALAKSSAEFSALLKDYNDGIMLYEIEQDRVWRRVTPSDSLLKIYFNQNREKFTYPERLNLLVATTSWQPDCEAVFAQVQRGKTLQEIYSADSAQASRPTHFSASFARNSTRVSSQSGKTLATVAAELSADTTLRLVVTAWPDTNTQKAKNERLALKRLTAIRTALSKKFKIPEHRISTTSMPQGPKPASDSLARVMATTNHRLDMDIVGRRMRMVGPPTTVLLARDADERATRADTLAPGAYTGPFPFKGQNLVIRLVGREAPRQKTFEEATPEVSTAFQDYESKRLESSWIEGLKREFPVVEHKEVLKEAFAPAR